MKIFRDCAKKLGRWVNSSGGGSLFLDLRSSISPKIAWTLADLVRFA
jgi:hypothetical protein